jgi:hypothetical protein
MADEQTEDEISQDAPESEALANVKEISEDLTEEKENAVEIEIHEVPPPEVVAEEVPSEVAQVNEDKSSESINPPAEDPQLEEGAVVDNPTAENDLTEEAVDERPETVETVDDEVADVPPMEEGKRHVSRLLMISGQL